MDTPLTVQEAVSLATRDFGFLLALRAHGVPLNFDQFAVRIRAHTTDPKAREIADVIATVKGDIRRKGAGYVSRYAA